MSTVSRRWVGLWVLGVAGASGADLGERTTTGPADWFAWQAARRESVAGTNGWTTLVGLHWLQEGVNFAGSAPTNHVVLPRNRGADMLGRFTRTGEVVSFEAAPGTEVRADGTLVHAIPLRSDTPGPATRLEVGALSIMLLKRGERLALRVRDPEARARQEFRSLDYFPYAPEWRLEARFEPHPLPRRLQFQDVTGGTQTMVSSGAVVFVASGTEHRLDVTAEPNDPELFLVFRDLTSGVSTYAGGRFLRVPKPDAEGHLAVDFNRAYNPPCAFTPFATCPLPPPQYALPSR